MKMTFINNKNDFYYTYFSSLNSYENIYTYYGVVFEFTSTITGN